MNKYININSVLSFLVIVAIGVATIYVLSWISPKEETATAPSVEVPTNATSTPIENVSVLHLVSKPYTPTKDVLSNPDAYKSQSIRLILNGDFEKASLRIKGEVTEKGDHFLSLVYGDVGGTINAYRESQTKLNKTLTQQSGGVFTDANPIDVMLDLFNPIQLSTTRGEYEKNQQTSKLINPWQSNLLPPTHISLLVAPFNEYGIYGGAQITLDLEYSCGTGSTCKAAICPAGQLTTVCLRDAFGAYAAKDWCKRAGYTSCSF
ncbi:MAG: hypothetical protein UW55_C0035G0004 [Candidatus Giovannonibacteria bacterium GW2011_GWA2_44_26]|uniref:Uncharacterized protein n=2 Tax=Candidatus Giovannoniibacteriota TaxID=1752738 RepID=A0A0G1IQ21_9BACT|nr:MAG: hypothetical protein UW55_C0035G0004 [Candidatus Giovannonibacteria bacterium GW2011_GWA2_44_26]